MKKVLVAGGAGYIGSLLAKELLKKKYDVTVVDSLWFGNFLPKQVNLKQKSIIDLTEEELRGQDVVIFMAGVSNDPMADYSPSVNFVENCAVPSYLAYMSKRAGVKRFIYASSCSVYGYTANNLMDENSPVSPQYPYGISKLAIENMIMNMEDSNFKPISLRKGTVGGYSPRMRFDLVVNAMTKTALTDEIKAELEAHGHGVEIETKNIKDVRNYKVCNEKSKIELDFVAKYSPRDSVKEILKNINIEKINFFDDKYYNIKVFKELF